MHDAEVARATLAHWFWRGLTALVFAGTLAMLFVRPVAAATPSATPGWSGTWRVALTLPGGSLPFGLEVRQDKAGTTAWLLNAPERARVERVGLAGDTITLGWPSYGSELVLTRTGDSLSGEAHLSRSSGPATVAASGVRGRWRFSANPAAPATNIAGKWLLRYGAKNEAGLAQLTQKGSSVSGSIQLPSGDVRYLAGDLSGNRLSLSTFDGNAATLWIATLEKGNFTGAQFTATGSRTGTPWTARPAGKDKVAAVVVEPPGGQRLAFSFPASDGRKVSLSDARYKGKVVVITLGGAWCPNCHDEAIFMGPYAARRQKEGLEVIGLHFEYGEDATRAFRLIDNYKARYKLPYPLLLAGQPTPESTKAALGALGPVKVYPSTIFIGRDGRVREVHVGWAGPATGALNAEAKRDFDTTVSRLLREKA